MLVAAGRVTEKCTVCGHENNHDQDDCTNCGTPLGHRSELGDTDLGETHEDPTEDILTDDDFTIP